MIFWDLIRGISNLRAVTAEAQTLMPVEQMLTTMGFDGASSSKPQGSSSSGEKT